MPRFTFAKPEHLCLRSDIERLFSAGSSSLTIYPIRATYRTLPRPDRGSAVKVLVSVSKRRLHHAVDRNRAKRQLREAYRLQKHILSASLPPETGLHVAFIWLAGHAVDTATVQERIQTLLQRISERLQAPPAQ